jgi:hypothetical protein
MDRAITAATTTFCVSPTAAWDALPVWLEHDRREQRYGG